MSALLGQVNEHYCYVCEEPLDISEEHMEFATKISSLHCRYCGRMYEVEFPITGAGHPSIRLVGYGGEWE